MTAIKARTTTVVVFQGDDLDPIEAARQKVEEAGVRQNTAQQVADSQREGAPRRMGDTSAVDELSASSQALRDAAREYDDLMEAAEERGEKVVLQAVGRKRWRDLLKAHPVRMVEGKDADGNPTEVEHEMDSAYGFDYESLCDDLVPESAVDKTAHDEAFFDSLSDGDYSRIYTAAVVLNRGEGPDPKARISSRIAPTTGGTSESPARMA